MRTTNYSLILLASFLIACANSQETVKQTPKKENDVQLIDDQKKSDSLKTALPANIDTVITQKEIPKEVQAPSKKFIVQLGAFSSFERAQNFINENQSKIPQIMKIVFRDDIKLFTVQIPPYLTHEEAEKVRNELWLKPGFKDAFILSINN